MSTCGAWVTDLSELSLELHDVKLEVIRRELRSAFLASETQRLEYVVGRPQVEAGINRVTTF